MPALLGPPRRVPARAALATWAGFGFAAMLLLTAAMAYTASRLARDDFRLPRRDWQLDAATELALATGEVRSVEPEDPGDDGYRRVGYAFAIDGGQQQLGSSWIRRGRPGIGQSVSIGYLPDEPRIHRLRGGHSTLAAFLLPGLAGSLLLPALLATALWLARSYRTYATLRHGRAAMARLIEQPTPVVLPGQVRVRYAFSDQLGRQQQAAQWVAKASPLGRVVGTAGPGQELDGAIAIHRTERPQYCRLIAASELSEATA